MDKSSWDNHETINQKDGWLPSRRVKERVEEGFGGDRDIIGEKGLKRFGPGLKKGSASPCLSLESEHYG